MPVQCTCGVCGKPFTETASRLNDNRGKWCSQACYWESKRKRPEDAWLLVDQSGGPAACWEWQGTITRWGYGQFKTHGVLWRAHRLIFTLVNGPIPDGLVVRHACDNRRCCNPAHLELGTHDDNMADAVSRDRMASGDRAFARIHPERMLRGERHGMAKLTESDVLAIIAKRQNGVAVAKLASEYSVCLTSIHNILTGKTWNHVTRPLAELTEQGQGPGCR